MEEKKAPIQEPNNDTDTRIVQTAEEILSRFAEAFAELAK